MLKNFLEEAVALLRISSDLNKKFEKIVCLVFACVAKTVCSLEHELRYSPTTISFTRYTSRVIPRVFQREKSKDHAWVYNFTRLNKHALFYA